METSDIDFILTWVDGSDPEWVKQFNEYTIGLEGDKGPCRFRDWENLHFIFRGIERFAPWVRRVHFVTWGHLPGWLNVEHEKLNIVRHSDFLKRQNLPVFNSHAIEVNLHRISGLSDKFVYFNDDTFLIKDVSEGRFFKKGLPRDMLTFNALSDSKIANIKINDLQTVNKYFDKKDLFRDNILKTFNFKYNLIEMIKTILLIPWPKFTGFYDPHLPQPYLKKIFFEVWENESDLLSRTSASRVRSCQDVNQYLFRYWQLCKGEFCPIGFKKHYFDWITNFSTALKFSHEILCGKYEIVCINDGLTEEDDFEKIRNVVNSAFEKILPDKSTFEN